ncbi:MAG: thermonuclease family protein [Bauldia sp.]|nr:thermonuclease family protein [Bauldia sp.]
MRSARRLALLAALVVMAAAIPASAARLTGAAEVVDGDTIILHGVTMRLHGVDAPEPAQQCTDAAGASWECGLAATEALRAFLAAGAPVTCETLGEDRFGRTISDCRTAGGASVSEWLVAEGWALAHPGLGGEAFGLLELDALAAGKGLWAGPFTPPWIWRGLAVPELAELAALSDEGCLVKGDVTPEGGRVYRLPDWPGYAATVIAAEEGDRWFCTEGDAMAAGFRAPRG